MKIFSFFFGLCFFLLLASAAPAAPKGTTYPEKAIKVISSWPGGGGGDQEIRAICLYLKKYLKAEIIIENVPGADTRIALTKAWKAKPDGYTLIYISPPQPILNEYLFQTEYRTKDFVPIYSFFNRVVTMTVPADTWRDFDEFAKDVRGKSLAIGLSSFGSASHVNAIGVAKELGINAKWIPYATGSQAVTQLAGKHIDVAFTMGTTALSLILSGKIRPLLQFSEVRAAGFESVPNPKEKGYRIPMLTGLGGFVAPPKTPNAVVKVLEEAFDKVSHDPEFLDWTQKTAHDMLRLRSDAFKKKLLEQYRIVEESIPLVKQTMGK